MSEESVLTSSITCGLTTSLLFRSNCRYEVQQGLCAADVDLRKAFYRILGLRGVPIKLIDLMPEFYSGTESAVMCGGSISDIFSVVTEICQGCLLAQTHFHTCMDWILGRMLEGSSCGASFRKVKISELDFSDDAVIFAETLDILKWALKAQNMEWFYGPTR